jgi:predicted aconitase with swiveling domain
MGRRDSVVEIKAHTICAGVAEGEAVVYQGPFSFLGDLDPATGNICAPRHPLEGESIVGKVFVFTTGKGSSGGDATAWIAKQNGNIPHAIICLESEPVLSSAVITTQIPTVDKPEKNIFEILKTGDFIRVDASSGTIKVIEKPEE